MTLYFAEYGATNDATIVFVHGAGIAGWLWHHQVDVLQTDFHCLVPDLPAHRDSREIQPFSIADSVNYLGECIRHHAHDGKAHLIGISLGGLICIELVAQHPELVNRVMISAPPSGPFPGTSLMILMSRFMMPVIRSDFVIKQTAQQLKLPDDDYDNYRRDQKAMQAETMRQIARDIHEHRLPSTLQMSSIPLLALVAERDNAINYRVVRDLIEMMPTAQGYIAPTVGHVWSAEKPSFFNQVAHEWLLDKRVCDALTPLSE